MSWYLPWTWFPRPLKALPPPINGPGNESYGFTPISGRITGYGYGGDTTPDTNSRNAIGAWDNTLVDSFSLAVSPDVEEAFRKAGMVPKQRVQLELYSGAFVTLRWDDRTANDKQAAQIGLKPLRGRFDVYTKAVPTRLIDQRVIAFKPL